LWLNLDPARTTTRPGRTHLWRTRMIDTTELTENLKVTFAAIDTALGHEYVRRNPQVVAAVAAALVRAASESPAT
jgi:hypothetical protein